MKTIHNPRDRAGIIARIDALAPAHAPLWGKMSAPQMLHHCRLWEEMALGRLHFRRNFAGRIFGRMVLNRLVSDERELTRNTPTIPALLDGPFGEPGAEKAAWISLLEEPHPSIVHPFFGPMTADEGAILAYKHADHHLRQFGA